MVLKLGLIRKYLLNITSLNYIYISEIHLLGLIQLPNETNIFPPNSQGTFSVSLKNQVVLCLANIIIIM